MTAHGSSPLVGAVQAKPSSPVDVLLVEAVARRVVELLDERERPAVSGGLVDAETLAGALGVDRTFVYRHRDRLGAIRLGDGPRAPLRFDLEAAKRAMFCSTSRESVAEIASVDGQSSRRGRGRKGRLPNRLPKLSELLAEERAG